MEADSLSMATSYDNYSLFQQSEQDIPGYQLLENKSKMVRFTHVLLVDILMTSG